MSKHEVTSDAIVHAIDGLHAIQNAVILELLDWVVEYDTREAWKEDGACSLADWLAFRLGYSAATAREIVCAAHALTVLPCTREAFAAGRVSWDKVLLITTVADTDSDELWATEAEHMSVARLERWVREHRRMSREDEDRKLRERYLRLRWCDDESLRVNGRLVGAEAVA